MFSLLLVFRQAVLVTGALILFSVMGLSFCHQRALNQVSPPPLEHPFLNAISQTKYKFFNLDQGFGNWPPYHDKSWGLFLEVHVSNPLKEYLSRGLSYGEIDESEIRRLAESEQWLFFTTLAGEKVDWRQIFSLEPEPEFWIFSFRNYEPGQVPALIREIEELGIDGRFLIASQNEGLLEDLRDKRPFWIYTSSLRQNVILRMLSSLRVPALSPSRYDVMFLHNFHQLHSETKKNKRDFSFDDRALAELERLRRPIIAPCGQHYCVN